MPAAISLALDALMEYATRLPSEQASSGGWKGLHVPFWKNGAMKDEGDSTLDSV